MLKIVENKSLSWVGVNANTLRREDCHILQTFMLQDERGCMNKQQVVNVRNKKINITKLFVL